MVQIAPAYNKMKHWDKRSLSTRYIGRYVQNDMDFINLLPSIRRACLILLLLIFLTKINILEGHGQTGSGLRATPLVLKSILRATPFFPTGNNYVLQKMFKLRLPMNYKLPFEEINTAFAIDFVDIRI